MVMQQVIDRSRYFLLSPVLLIFFVCMMGEPLLSSSDEPALKRDDSTLRIEPLRLSALPGSALPNLTVDSSGDALLTWVEPDPDGRG
ncbi:MAG: hypothetical protein AAEJ65_02765, partial [Planctomycetota bacterium]